MTLAELTKAIRTDLMVPDTTLANLATACTQRLANHAEAQERRSTLQACTQGLTQSKLQLR